ncbi:winged helix-turn-helix domain-containing protein [bacterium]|nr:MAG: hypothetical protein EDS67_19965 [candidate division KSB1 bacterium]MCE7945033.1 hypothetical protein [Chlorobi bacterium CHB1]MCL4704469.1 winged helix-turn-helix domain-containing protein [bacterium]MDL1877564.1 hypothetical protein [Cytophagia bacterium CHB2]MBC6947515.1 hypothetical protein [candidate division KSB1 bacterium]
MMTGEIGQVAGKIWQALQGKEDMTPTNLKKATGADDKLLWLALGWLAREDNIDIAKNKSSYKINLKAK